MIFNFINEIKRSELDSNKFGIPEDRKFPLDSAEHVRSAIKLFGHAEDGKKETLAHNISNAAKKYNIDIPETTQVYKYLKESTVYTTKADQTNRFYDELKKKLSEKEEENELDMPATISAYTALENVGYNSVQELLDNTDHKHIYLSSDWHLFKNHYKHEANYVNTSKIVSWCKKNIKPDDVFMYLGDISYRWVNKEDAAEAQKIFKSLPGIKILILGNHDIMAGEDFYTNCGFDYIFEELVWHQYTFTHKPIDMKNAPSESYSIHGHLHKWQEFNTCDGAKNLNVYPWYFDNKPVTLDYLLKYKNKLTKDNKRSNWVGMGESVIINESFNRESINSEYLEKGDTCYNLELLNPNNNNILYVTGLSGSGKTTLAEDLRKELNCYRVELDFIYVYYFKKTKDLNRYQKMYDKVYAECPEAAEFFDNNKPGVVYDYRTDWNDMSILKDFFEWFIPKVSDNGNIYIINGAQIITTFKPEYFYNRPIIIKDSTWIKCGLRRAKREMDVDDKFINNLKSFYDKLKISLSKDYRLSVKKYSIYNNDLSKHSLTVEQSNILQECSNMIKSFMNKSVKEFALNACNPIIPTRKPFIVQLSSNSSVFSGSKYAFSEDIVSNKYLVVNEDSKLEIVNVSDLDNYTAKVYEYTGDKFNIKKLEKAYKEDATVDQAFIYTTLSNKKLITKDQIDFDDNFVPVDIELIKEKNNSDIETMKEQFSSEFGDNTDKYFSLPIIENAILDNPLKGELARYKDNIHIMESVDGYYVSNDITKKRSKCVPSLDDITEAMVKSIY